MGWAVMLNQQLEIMSQWWSWVLTAHIGSVHNTPTEGRGGREGERSGTCEQTRQWQVYSLREAFTTLVSKVYAEVIGRKRAWRQVQKVCTMFFSSQAV